MQGGTNFVADVGLTSGTNSVPVVAKDANNNTRTNTIQVIVPGGTGKTISYDAAGNTTSDGTHTFTWDAASRLVKITYADSATSEFGYDAFGRRIRITEKDTSGTATSTKQFLWDGLAIAEERDASNSVTARYFEQGFQRIQVSPSLTQNYFTSRDHLGSIREVVDNTGTLVTRYNYDPFGRITKLSGTIDSDMLYTGHYCNSLAVFCMKSSGCENVFKISWKLALDFYCKQAHQYACYAFVICLKPLGISAKRRNVFAKKF